MIAALYVQKDGPYFGLEGVDPWDEARDARLYAGPHAVVAHPPCERWGRFWFGSPLGVAKTGVRKVKGDDGGCFAAALSSVRLYGGVIEHPEGSHAYAHFGLGKPLAAGWTRSADGLGWICRVEQGFYGHYARKATWLYAVATALPDLRWGKGERRLDPVMVERYGEKRAARLGEVGAKGGGSKAGHDIRAATPPEFREMLIALAKSV